MSTSRQEGWNCLFIRLGAECAAESPVIAQGLLKRGVEDSKYTDLIFDLC